VEEALAFWDEQVAAAMSPTIVRIVGDMACVKTTFADVHQMLIFERKVGAILKRLWGRALAGGPTVLRIVGEMACERPMFASAADMIAYEEAYEVMTRRFPAVTLCQYDAREFDGEIMLRALKAHPDMFELHLGGFLN
jgi:hypothetical protein